MEWGRAVWERRLRGLACCGTQGFCSWQVGQAFTVKMTLMSACCSHATRECASRMSPAKATPASVGPDLWWVLLSTPSHPPHSLSSSSSPEVIWEGNNPVCRSPVKYLPYACCCSVWPLNILDIFSNGKPCGFLVTTAPGEKRRCHLWCPWIKHLLHLSSLSIMFSV